MKRRAMIARGFAPNADRWLEVLLGVVQRCTCVVYVSLGYHEHEHDGYGYRYMNTTITTRECSAIHNGRDEECV